MVAKLPTTRFSVDVTTKRVIWSQVYLLPPAAIMRYNFVNISTFSHILFEDAI